MKKYIWISFLLILSCGARKSKVEKFSQKTEIKTGQNLSKEVETSSQSETAYNFSNLAENESFSIAGGMPYTLNYKGLVYSGSSPIEISKNKTETRINWIQKIKTTYRTATKYQTETTYKSQTTYKNKETEKEAYPFWLWIAVGFFLKILVGFTWEKIKVSNPYLRIIKKLKS